MILVMEYFSFLQKNHWKNVFLYYKLKFMEIEKIRLAVKEDLIRWSDHCLERMRIRKIPVRRVLDCIMNGEIIREYPEDKPHPSCLIFDKEGIDVVHVVVGVSDIYVYMITAYRPNLEIFNDDFKTRR